MKTKQVEKKYSLVTGGSKGIGKAIVNYLLDNQYHVAFSYRHRKDMQQLMDDVGDKKKYLLPIFADMSIHEECENFVLEAYLQFGRVDLLVNNVGITRDCLLASASNKDIYRVLDTNLLSYILCCREVLKIMLPQRYGNIINISSISAMRPNKGQSVYAATKGAIESLTKALSVEMAPKNIRVNAIAPGIIRTEMVESLLESHKNIVEERVLLKRLGSVENIIVGIDYLLNNDYVTGEVININGGLSLT
ncbi:SDR family NAD(P)-dependent oxidoreductase [Jejubacter calystegiae]|uniref:SDR family NAD(P)-dependent oxidoreductase n=1 Tax=Jejubacter calystegiae TaxID=2579935 RepID=UPI00143D89F5|nr:SDR family NAD(P)-dependent oxidoreductase [Jejubacter calystegiae]